MSGAEGLEKKRYENLFGCWSCRRELEQLVMDLQEKTGAAGYGSAGENWCCLLWICRRELEQPVMICRRELEKPVMICRRELVQPVMDLQERTGAAGYGSAGENWCCLLWICRRELVLPVMDLQERTGAACYGLQERTGAAC
jgi:hypothetical protein